MSLPTYPDLYFAGYTQDAVKEFVEANLVYALARGHRLPYAGHSWPDRPGRGRALHG